jgi:hypothetical protein
VPPNSESTNQRTDQKADYGQLERGRSGVPGTPAALRISKKGTAEAEPISRAEDAGRQAAALRLDARSRDICDPRPLDEALGLSGWLRRMP